MTLCLAMIKIDKHQSLPYVMTASKRPNLLTPNLEDGPLVVRFRSAYRSKGPQLAGNLPTACILVRATESNLNEVRGLAGSKEVVVCWDDVSLLRRCTFPEVESFIENRQPWEDYDFCVFPLDLSWCAGFTHNARWFISRAEGIYA